MLCSSPNVMNLQVGLDHISLMLALELCEFSSKLDNVASYE